jgi:hypothetical protein
MRIWVLTIAILVGMTAGLVEAAPVILNPSFEDDGWPADKQDLTGWNHIQVPSGDGNWAGLDTMGANNRNMWENGLTTDGLYAMTLEPWGPVPGGSNPMWLDQTINGFEIGKTYRISFSYNARAYTGGVGGTTPIFTIKMDGVDVFADPALVPVEATGSHTLPFYTNHFDYTATAVSHTLRIHAEADDGTPNNDETLIIDDFEITEVGGGAATPGTLIYSK